MVSNSDDDFEAAALALNFLQRFRRSLLHRKKRTHWVQERIFSYFAKASSSSMLHLFAFHIAAVSRTSVCNSDKIPQEIRWASDAALA